MNSYIIKVYPRGVEVVMQGDDIMNIKLTQAASEELKKINVDKLRIFVQGYG